MQDEKRTIAARKAGSVKSEKKRVQSSKNLALARARKAEIFRMYREQGLKRPSKTSAAKSTNAGA